MTSPCFVRAAALCAAVLAATTANAEQGGWRDNRDRAVGLIESSDSTYCSGTVIGRRVVLTAAHCVGNVVAFYIGHGVAAATTGPAMAAMTRYAVDHQEKFPSYGGNACPNETGDFGLLHLTTDIDHNIPAVRYGGERTSVGATCDAIGFGRHMVHGATTKGEKRRTSVKVTRAGNRVITADWLTGISDKGDSGGPLYCGNEGRNDYIFGVVSCHADGEGAKHRREYYANINEATSWIHRVVQGWSAAGAPAAAKKPGAAKKAKAAAKE
jgi:secreted trypsin-like serine protease